HHAPVAQLESALPAGGRGLRFASSRARHFLPVKPPPSSLCRRFPAASQGGVSAAAPAAKLKWQYCVALPLISKQSAVGAQSDSQARPDAESACDQAREANMNSSDALSRFLEAQDPVYEIALAELRAGRKRSHWMWFIFPQLRSLGRSSTAQFYGIADRAEAQAYLAHPRLGARLVECTHAVLAHKHSS